MKRTTIPFWLVFIDGGDADGGGQSAVDQQVDQQAPPVDPGPQPGPEVDWKAKSREWERKAKANADAARRLSAIEESQKTEAQRQSERIAALEAETAEARADALRMRVAAKHGISEDDAALFLTASDEETITRQAVRLAAREAERRKTGGVARNEGTTPPTGSGDPMRDFTRTLFADAATD